MGRGSRYLHILHEALVFAEAPQKQSQLNYQSSAEAEWGRRSRAEGKQDHGAPESQPSATSAASTNRYAFHTKGKPIRRCYQAPRLPRKVP